MTLLIDFQTNNVDANGYYPNVIKLSRSLTGVEAEPVGLAIA